MGASQKAEEEIILPVTHSSGSFRSKAEETDDAFEVFKKEAGAVDFRTVGWIPASVIFLKVIFATGMHPSTQFKLVMLSPG